jgi:hypothetical protein
VMELCCALHNFQVRLTPCALSVSESIVWLGQARRECRRVAR